MIDVCIPFTFWGTNFWQYLRDYFCCCHLGIRCITMGIQNNSSHIVLCRKSIHLGAFLVPVPIDKPTFKGFHLMQVHLSFICEELEILRSGNKETLALGLCKKPPSTEQGGFFVPNKKHSWVKLLIRLLKFIFKDDHEVPLTSITYLCCFRCRYSNSWSPSICFSWLIWV